MRRGQVLAAIGWMVFIAILTRGWLAIAGERVRSLSGRQFERLDASGRAIRKGGRQAVGTTPFDELDPADQERILAAESALFANPPPQEYIERIGNALNK